MSEDQTRLQETVSVRPSNQFAVMFLFAQETTEPMETHFLLADNVYCKASVPPTDKVCLWLGVRTAQIKAGFIFWREIFDHKKHV